jgi:hypothetical protein
MSIELFDQVSGEVDVGGGAKVCCGANGAGMCGQGAVIN